MNAQTVAKAKKELQAVRAEQRELKILIEQSSALRWSLLPSAIDYNKDNIQTSPTDIFSEKMVEACELMRVIEKHAARLEHHKAQTMKNIQRMEDSNCRTVLMLYYLGESGKLYKWGEVAKKMNYSVDHTWKIHGRALKQYAKITEGKGEKSSVKHNSK